MDRVHASGFRAPIEAALRLIPATLQDFVSADFACGLDPIFVGLHQYEETDDGRSYRDTAHCVYLHHQLHLPRARRRTTVVLPEPVVPEVVVHELGHVLHERLDWGHTASPVSWYAEANWCEAFAEAFTSWLVPGYAERPDEKTLALFEQLAGV